MNRLLPFDAYYHIFNRWRNSTAFFLADKGNVGDELLRCATWQIFEYFNISRTEIIDESDVVFWGAGGNMGPLYPHTVTARKLLSLQCDKLQKPFVILPQSWNGFEDITPNWSFVREVYSLKFSQYSQIAPDMALSYLSSMKINNATNDVGLFFRKDDEKTSNIPLSRDPAFIARSVNEYLNLAWTYKVIHTNRLHFAIAGM